MMITKRFKNFITGKTHIIDHDNRKVHKIKNVNKNCKISNNIEYTTRVLSRNIEIYDYYSKCPYCNSQK